VDSLNHTESEAIKLFRNCIVNVPLDEWSAFVQAQVGSDSKIGTRLESMLDCHRNDDALLDGHKRHEASQVTPLSSRTDPFDDTGYSIGSKVGEYRVTDLLCHGTSSLLMRAESKFGCVVLKVPVVRTCVSQSLLQFESECRIHLSISHQNICPAFSLERTPSGCPVLVLQFIAGLGIEDFCVREQVSIERRIDLLLQIESGMRCLHRNGIVHGDLKSDNAMVERWGSKLVCRLIDFGKSRQFNQGDNQLRDLRGDGGAETQSSTGRIENEPSECADQFLNAVEQDKQDYSWLRNRLLTR